MNTRIIKAMLMAGVAAIAFAAPAMAGAWVVIDSSAPALAPGAEIADGQAIDVPPGASVSLVDQAGALVALKGPFSGVPAASSSGGDGRVAASLASLLRSGTEDTKSVGAVRAAAAKPETLADVLAVDASRPGGNHCIYDPAAVEIVRAPTAPATGFNVLSTDTGASAQIAWPDAATRQKWPAGVPLSDGATLVLESPGEKQAPILTIKVLQPMAMSDIGRAAEMADAGCTDQARYLVAIAARQAGAVTAPPPP